MPRNGSIWMLKILEEEGASREKKTPAYSNYWVSQFLLLEDVG